MGIPGGFGSVLVAGLISAMLYGITTLQTYVYYMHYSEDASTMKFLVAIVWILDTLHVSFMCHMLYCYLITNYGNLMSLEYIVWSFPASLLVNTFMLTIVQLFFVHKIYYLYRRQLRWLVVAPIILLALARVGFSTATAVVILVNNAVSFASHTRFFTAVPAACAVALAEVLITVSLCVLLYESGSRSAIPRTKRLLNTLIIYAVNRCLLTLPVAIAEVTVDVENMAAWTMAMDFIVGKLYANSLLGSLNTRQHLRSQDPDPVFDLRNNAVYVAGPPKLARDIRSSKVSARQFDECEVTVIDITAEPAFDYITALRGEAEV